MSLRRNITDDADYVRLLVEDAVWSIFYQEQVLAEAHRTLAVVKAVAARGFSEIDFDNVDADADADRDSAENPTDYMLCCAADAKSSVLYHEGELRDAHKTLAWVLAIVLRGKYDLDIDAIKREQGERRQKHKEKAGLK